MQQSQQAKRLIGQNAHREISARLSNYPLAQRLAQQVYDFYGYFLNYAEGRHFPSSVFAIKLQHAPVTLHSAAIQLQLGTDHTAESLAHELLHLQLPMVGFPLGEFVNIPFHLDPYARYFLGMCQWVLNLVQHEVIRPGFIALGFDQNRFLSMSGEIVDYQDLFLQRTRKDFTPEVDFAYWCMEYLKHWCSARHGWNDHSLDQAREARKWGARLYPELKETIAKIEEWIERGAFKTPCRYRHQVNFLLDLMRLPKFVSWVHLFSHCQKPVAVRLNFTGTPQLPFRDRVMDSQSRVIGGD